MEVGTFLRKPLLLTICLLFAGFASITNAQTPGNFVATGNMTTPRISYSATLLSDGRVLIAGGFAAVASTPGPIHGLSNAEIYDPATGVFTLTGSRMATDRYSHSATLLNSGKVLIAGGSSIDPTTGRWASVDSAELYDPATGQFTPAGSMTTPRGGHTATLLLDGRVLIAGGTVTGPPFEPGTSAELYDPATGTFTATGNMTIASWGDTATLLHDGTVLLASPYLYQGILVAGELFDPATGAFINKSNVTLSGYYWHAASLLADGRVLISGGGEVDTVGTFFAQSELYDPVTGKFTATGKMSTGRVLHTSTLLPDDTVLITGGLTDLYFRNPSPVTSSAELYDPSTGSFRLTGSMTTPRQNHTATLLTNGKVLITGGGDAFSPASAELYDPQATQPGHVAPWLFAVSPDGHGQGSILHAGTGRFASAGDPAATGDLLEIYCSGLDESEGAPAPEVTIGGQQATVLYFGDAPGYPRLNQVNVRVPSGVAAGSAVSVRMTDRGLPSNGVTIGVR